MAQISRIFGGIRKKRPNMGKQILKKAVKSREAARRKKRNILVVLILILIMRLFFYPYFEENVLAKRNVYLGKVKLALFDPLQKIGKKSFEQEDEIQNFSSIDAVESEEEKEQKARERVYFDLVHGSPMEEMVDEIAKKDKIVAAFLIGIARKESSWGEHSPKKNGKNCFNYWGYKGGQNPTASGYSCFDSPEQAVSVVGGRIGELVEKKINTPERMIVWKCGSSCAGHDPAGVKKWISDVSSYFYKLNS